MMGPARHRLIKREAPPKDRGRFGPDRSKRPAVRYHVPSAIPRLHKTIGPCDGSVAEYPRMKSRIDSIQTALFDEAAAFPPTRALAGGSHGSGAQDAQIG